MIPGRGRFAFHIPPESVFTSLRNPYSQFPGTLIHMPRNTHVRGLEGASIDACLVKPVRHSQLLNTLATAWSNKLQGAATGPTESEYRASLTALKSSVRGRLA